VRTDFHGAANPRQVLIEKAVAARRRLHASFALPNLASALFVQRRRLVDRLARRDEKAALCSQAPAGDKRAIALHGMPTSRQATMRAASGVDGGRAAVIDCGLALRPGELNSLVSNVPSCRCRLAAVTDSLFWLNVLCPAHDPFPLDFVSLC
jgi:hypothetical protein